MKTLSLLSNDPAFALAFRTLQPPPEKPASLLVLLHGVGGNENNLATLGAEAGRDTLVVLPRGPIALGPEAFGWFRVTFTGNGPQIVASEADASRRTLIDFIGQLQQTHGIDAAHTVVAGRSEEHTSELQSLMRISSAVFCLKKKNILHISTPTHQHSIHTSATTNSIETYTQNNIHT